MCISKVYVGVLLSFFLMSSGVSAQINLNNFLHKKDTSLKSLPVSSENVSVGVQADSEPCLVVDADVSLTFDVSCIVASGDVVIDLNGYTVNGNILSADLSGRVTIKNGIIEGGEIYLFGHNDHLIDSVKVNNYAGDFAVKIEGGRIVNSTFENNGTAIDLFYGNAIEVKDNRFINNRLAINVASDDDSIISGNFFQYNEVAIRLFDEDLYGVENTLINYNLFYENDVGVLMNAMNGVNGTVVERNVFRSNSSSAIIALIDCVKMSFGVAPEECAGRDTLILENIMTENGLDPRNVEGNFYGPDFEETIPYSVLADDGILILGIESESSTNGISLYGNLSFMNAGLGFNVEGVVDAGRNFARFNGDSQQCVGVGC